MAWHHEVPRLCHLQIYRLLSAGVQGSDWGPAELPSSSPFLPGLGKALGQLWERWVEVRSSGAGWCWPWQCCALLTVPMLSTCRTGLSPDAKHKAPLQGNKAATRDGVQAVSEEVGFGRGNLTLKTFYMIQIKPKYFSPLLMLDKAHP